MYRITPIPALSDNYIWMISRADAKSAIIVDPGEASPVLKMLEEKGLNLAAILVTHHHWDHTDGIPELLEKFPVPVYGPARDSVKYLTNPLAQDDRIHIPELDCDFLILDIPGHTLGHIAYLGLGGVFTGDTLFSAGCGRIFEGTPAQMFNSLNKLKNLPDETFVYCGHEYTEKNMEFAKLVEPKNPKLIEHMNDCAALRSHQKPTLPSTIQLEKSINPFLRCEEKAVQMAVEKYTGKKFTSPLEVFTELRQWKNKL